MEFYAADSWQVTPRVTFDYGVRYSLFYNPYVADNQLASFQPSLFARHPEWQPVFDMDGSMAVATRKKLLDRAAADRMLVQGYHFPFPASGYIGREGSGYHFVPVMWQPAL